MFMIYNYKFIKKYLDKKPGFIRILNKLIFVNKLKIIRQHQKTTNQKISCTDK